MRADGVSPRASIARPAGESKDCAFIANSKLARVQGVAESREAENCGRSRIVCSV